MAPSIRVAVTYVDRSVLYSWLRWVELRPVELAKRYIYGKLWQRYTVSVKIILPQYKYNNKPDKQSHAKNIFLTDLHENKISS